MDREVWPAGKARPTDLFKTRTRAEWCDLLEGTGACFAPVLSMREAPDHPHNRARGAFVEAFGLVRPAPAPRYSRGATRMPMLPVKGADSQWLLREAGFAEDRIRHLLNQGIVVADRG